MANNKKNGNSIAFCDSCGLEHVNKCLCAGDAKCGFCLAAIAKNKKARPSSWEFLKEIDGKIGLITANDLNGKTPVEKTVREYFSEYWQGKIPYTVVDGKKAFEIKTSEMERLHKYESEKGNFSITKMFSFGVKVF